jgi:hypothetical protein
MSEKTVPKVILAQLEDALEERQTNERRKQEAKLIPEGIPQERRKQSRRSAKK